MARPITAEEDEELRRLLAFADEATRELIAGGGVPDTVMGVMLKMTRENLTPLIFQCGMDRAVATIAAAAFFVGRKAERAGLVHAKPEETAP